MDFFGSVRNVELTKEALNITKVLDKQIDNNDQCNKEDCDDFKTEMRRQYSKVKQLPILSELNL